MYSRSHSLPRNREPLYYRLRYSHSSTRTYCSICWHYYLLQENWSLVCKCLFPLTLNLNACVYAQVDALRLRLEEKESLLSKKSQQISELTEEKSTQHGEISDLKDMLDVKERKVNVLQKKVRKHQILKYTPVKCLELNRSHINWCHVIRREFPVCNI